MMIEINGMAHVILTVSRFEVARAFYRELLPRFGMKPVFDGDHLFYCVGGRAAIGIQPCDPALDGARFVQQRVGLHHLCLRARSREDVFPPPATRPANQRRLERASANPKRPANLAPARPRWSEPSLSRRLG
jgi:catechol 2,3-dioxygenase-like lactoylglutathione lyase family enzyme